jgi:hypothetical protein
MIDVRHPVDCRLDMALAAKALGQRLIGTRRDDCDEHAHPMLRRHRQQAVERR